MSRRKKKPTIGKNSKVNVFINEFVDNEHFLMKSKCYVCESVEDEDMTILCDGGGCNNEVHMYCLEPIMTELPLGDWLCDFCDNWGSSKNLKNYFDSTAKTQRIPVNALYYADWLISLQSKFLKHESYKFNDFHHKSDLVGNDPELVGLHVTLVIDEVVCRCHNGRIVNRRLDASLTNRWEHLVQFKSGADGRNKTVMQWMCLEEHACFVGLDPVWLRAAGFTTWTPALRCGQTALHRAYRHQLISSSSNNSNSAGNDQSSFLFFVYVDEVLVDVRARDLSAGVATFESRIKAAVRPAMGKRLSVACAFVTAELEERSAVRSALLRSDEDVESCGLMVDNLTCGDLRALTAFSVLHAANDTLRLTTVSEEYKALGVRARQKEKCTERVQVEAALEAVVVRVVSGEESAPRECDSKDEYSSSIELKTDSGVNLSDVEMDLRSTSLHCLDLLSDLTTSKWEVGMPRLTTFGESSMCRSGLMDIVGECYRVHLEEEQAAHEAHLERDRQQREEKKRQKLETARRNREARQATIAQLSECATVTSSSSSSSSGAVLIDEDESLFPLGEVTRRSLRRFLRHAGGSIHSDVLDEIMSDMQTGANVDRESETDEGAEQHLQSYRHHLETMHDDVQALVSAQETAPVLLSDLERDRWHGAIVAYVPTGEIGRVVFFESGWNVVRSLRGIIRSRPYQLEVLPADCEACLNFEDAEILLIDAEATEFNPEEQIEVQQQTPFGEANPICTDDDLDLLMHFDEEEDEDGELFGREALTFSRHRTDSLDFCVDPFFGEQHLDDDGAYGSDTEYGDDCLSMDGNEDESKTAQSTQFDVDSTDQLRLESKGSEVRTKSSLRRRNLKPTRIKYIETLPAGMAQTIRTNSLAKRAQLSSSTSVAASKSVAAPHSSSSQVQTHRPRQYISFSATAPSATRKPTSSTVTTAGDDHKVAKAASLSSMVRVDDHKQLIDLSEERDNRCKVSISGQGLDCKERNDSPASHANHANKFNQAVKPKHDGPLWKKVTSHLPSAAAVPAAPSVRTRVIVMEDGERIEVIDHTAEEEEEEEQLVKAPPLLAEKNERVEKPKESTTVDIKTSHQQQHQQQQSQTHIQHKPSQNQETQQMKSESYKSRPPPRVAPPVIKRIDYNRPAAIRRTPGARPSAQPVVVPVRAPVVVPVVASAPLTVKQSVMDADFNLVEVEVLVSSINAPKSSDTDDIDSLLRDIESSSRQAGACELTSDFSLARFSPIYSPQDALGGWEDEVEKAPPATRLQQPQVELVAVTKVVDTKEGLGEEDLFRQYEAQQRYQQELLKRYGSTSLPQHHFQQHQQVVRTRPSDGLSDLLSRETTPSVQPAPRKSRFDVSSSASRDRAAAPRPASVEVLDLTGTTSISERKRSSRFEPLPSSSSSSSSRSAHHPHVTDLTQQSQPTNQSGGQHFQSRQDDWDHLQRQQQQNQSQQQPFVAHNAALPQQSQSSSHQQSNQPQPHVPRRSRFAPALSQAPAGNEASLDDGIKPVKPISVNDQDSVGGDRKKRQSYIECDMEVVAQSHFKQSNNQPSLNESVAAEDLRDKAQRRKQRRMERQAQIEEETRRLESDLDGFRVEQGPADDAWAEENAILLAEAEAAAMKKRIEAEAAVKEAQRLKELRAEERLQRLKEQQEEGEELEELSSGDDASRIDATRSQNQATNRTKKRGGKRNNKRKGEFSGQLQASECGVDVLDGSFGFAHQLSDQGESSVDLYNAQSTLSLVDPYGTAYPQRPNQVYLEQPIRYYHAFQEQQQDEHRDTDHFQNHQQMQQLTQNHFQQQQQQYTYQMKTQTQNQQQNQQQPQQQWFDPDAAHVAVPVGWQENTQAFGGQQQRFRNSRFQQI